MLRMEHATRFVSQAWNPDRMLGVAIKQVNGLDAAIACLHELPMAIGNIFLSLHGMDGPLVKV